MGERAQASAGERLAGTPAPARHWIASDGVRLAGDSWGDPTAPLVMLLHGGGQTRHAWKSTGERLAELGFRSVALDARGHGDSEWAPPDGYGEMRMVEDIATVTRTLDAGPPVLVGASMGGVVSLLGVGTGALDASALVLVDVAHRLEDDGVRNIAAFMDGAPDGFASIAEATQAVSAFQPHRPAPARGDGLAKNLRLGEDGRYHWHWDPQFREGMLPTDDRTALLAACARALKVPTLLVRGAVSDVLSEAGAAEFRELCPHAEYADIAGAAHMIAGDENDAFTEVVAGFIARAVDRSAPRRH